MNYQLNRLLILTLLAVVSGRALGDDIELFVSTGNQEFQCEVPNVVFLIDTSGSMSSDVETQADWNPQEIYSGCFESDSFYFNSTGSPPQCASDAHFKKAVSKCDAIRNTEYTGEFQFWDPDNERWNKLTEGVHGQFTECAQDEGLHGDGSSDETYAVDGPAGPWSSDPNSRIAWGANASSVTVFDGNWLNWLRNPPTVTKSRLDIVKEVTKAALDNIDSVNVALMEFNFEDGGSVLQAFEPIETARDPLKQIIDNLSPDGQTPLSESLYELGQYFRGGTIEYGKPQSGESVANARIGGTLASGVYLSPLNFTGQNSYIVLLTDGEPANDNKANRLIEGLPDYGTLVGDACDDSVNGSCLDSMAAYLFEADLRPDIPGKQNVITHTIGFTIDLPLLASTAARGGGKYFVADSTASLTSVLSNLANDFARSASLLTAPQIPINSFNQAERLNDVYVSVFQPAASQHWPGNLKRYRRQQMSSGTILVDANGNNVIDPATGFFRENAVSFWSNPLVDGDSATLGGAASQLPPSAARKLLSNVGGLGLEEVRISNTSITATMIGAPDGEREITIAWARGLDSRDADEDGDTLEQRLSIGDPLHVQPVTVAYGADAANSNAIVFVATNDGYLHAFNAVDGVEIWSFIPRRLLGRLYELSLEEPSATKEYGLDGTLQVIETAGRKIIVFGMRRGGAAMFAMDVTNRTTPQLLWEIDSSQAEFRDLGQTWSPANAARVSIGGAAKDVILFGGGYDAGQDNGVFRSDTKGNAIYMVNTLTGALEWSAGSPGAQSNHDLALTRMNFSIPARLRTLDRNEDGLTDRIYVGDMGGQVWRIDIINGQGRSTLGQGGVIASLGGADAGTPLRADARRFYNTPGVVDVIRNGKLFTAINIGSGYRAHPLDAATDEEFFSIRDFQPQQAIATELYGTESLPVITRADLPDITDNVTILPEESDPGWRLRMEGSGEKILASSLTISDILHFNSFTPSAANNSCLPGGGQNRLYRVNILTGAPVTNLDGSVDADNLTKEDRSVSVGRPQDVPLDLVYDPGGPCVGLGCFGDSNALNPDSGDDDGDGGGIGTPDRVYETYWFPVTRP